MQDIKLNEKRIGRQSLHKDNACNTNKEKSL